jgi:putative transposase
VQDWPYSTFHRYVKQGVYDTDWGGGNFDTSVFDDLDTTAME